jgi:acetylornithine/N-succinyldiaminopimelate aminotransferase
MDLFKVYKLWDIEPVRGLDTTLWDKDGVEYTDLYGGHAVISIGHCHPHYVKMLQEQLTRLGFYSNAVQNSLQQELARRLGKASGYDDYSLFLCNSGAEANENAMKLASFATGRARVLAFSKSFHGRTSGAVAATDNPKIRAPFNASANVSFVPLGDLEAVEKALSGGEYAAVIIEGIQGVAGIYEPSDEFFRGLRSLCDKYGTLLIVDEIQSGYGRSGLFFAHQHSGVRADIITTAKGMANGLPIGGVLIAPHIKPEYGMLGTTFGGNHLACTAAIAVLDVIESEHLIENAAKVGEHFRAEFNGPDGLDPALKEYRGRGLMIGLELKPEYIGLRDRLLFEKHFFTGAAGASVIRLLPSLTISEQTADRFISAWKELTTKAE